MEVKWYHDLFMLNPKKLRAARLTAGLTQGEVARRLGIDHSHVSHMEAGRRGVSVKRLMRLAALYAVELDALTTRPPAPKPRV